MAITTLNSLNIAELEPQVAAAIAGDAEAFGRLIGATSSLVSSIALAIVRDVDLSQEIAQDVFLSAWRDLKKLRNPASFLPWLRQMTRNRAHHVLRGRVRARRWMVQLTGDREAEMIADARSGAAERLLANEQHEALREAMSLLPDGTREVLVLYYREGQSAAQVGALLDLSEDAVKQRLSRARTALRERLLTRLGDTLVTTRPGAAFTMAVVAALPLTMPLTASAATMIQGAATKAAGGGVLGTVGAWLLWLLTPILAILVTAVGGLFGIVMGGRVLMREARDDEERRGLRRFQIVSIMVVLATAAIWQLGTNIIKSPWLPAAILGAFTGTMISLHLAWLPQIVKRPVDRQQVIGLTLGVGAAWLAFIIGRAL